MQMVTSGDSRLVQIIDSALADASARGGERLRCHKGCTRCCMGVFAINQLDAMRLRRGLAQLEQTAPERARMVRARASETLVRLRHDFPGDATTGVLGESEEESERFEDFANDEVCPALDPQTGGCELYAHRPITCRIFGPPVRTEQGLGVCELCFEGASTEELLRCEMIVDPDDYEAELLRELEEQTGMGGQTIIAWALAL